MFVYSVYINIIEEMHEEWLKWMLEIHIPEVMDTGLFTSYKVYKVINDPYHDEGVSYNIHYYCNSMDDYTTYHTQFAKSLQKKHTDKFGGFFEAGRSLMEEVSKK